MPSDPKSPIDDELEREIAEALGETSLMGLGRPTVPPRAPGAPPRPRSTASLSERLAQSSPPGPPGAAPEGPATGSKSGVVTHVGAEDVFLEFGPREQGVVPRAQFGEEPAVGATLKVHVESFDNKEGLYLCSLRRGVQSAEWATVEKGAVLMGTVMAVNKGGLDLKVGQLSAFLPASHVALERIEALDSLIGQTFQVEVIEADRERHRIVVSRRGMLARAREEKRTSAVKTLMVGTTVTGKITKVEPFGCFVDVGGIEGLVHVSQIAWKRVEKPEEVVKAGDQVKVQVLEVSEDGRRISLSMKALVEDPWLGWTQSHHAGSLVEGTVTRLATYGAFVEVADGIEGLAHVSQLAPGGARTTKEVLRAGQKVVVRVVTIDPLQKRIGLSLLTERGDRLTDDVADDATIRDVVGKGLARPAEPTLGDLLQRALKPDPKSPGKPKR